MEQVALNDSDFLGDMEVDAADNTEHLEVTPENIDDTLFLRNLALFYLKLQAKLLLPSSTVQSLKICSQYMTSASHNSFLN